MLKDTPSTRILSKHKIKIEENVLSVNSGKKAYVALNKITAVEFDSSTLFATVFLGILAILIGIFLNFVFDSAVPALIGLGLAFMSIMVGLITIRVNIYASGYKLMLQGKYKDMKELYEELKKLV
ncbi:vacuolar-type H+-ATPase subunit I/STV1 [Methanococcus voltae PS]|uniref:Vacuolar-type H+-ATPase subunit I/STV1 n=1 Tax=Methanococcus voltae PS TaxID=523842 RepID=A0ABT2EX87_METVO|nr:hypothetical protein [Methanococcus voltae]MCS3922574.1 vacuolar-type H+-ATPase subunit I/STV1 [Methanococcus voltae PS]